MEIIALILPFTFELRRHILDDVFILSMHGHDPAMFRHLSEHTPQVPPRHPHRMVHREYFEAAEPFFEGFTNFAHGFWSHLSGNDVMKGEIRITMRTKDLASALERFQRRPPAEAAQRFAAQVTGKINDRGDPAKCCGSAGCLWWLCHDFGLPSPVGGHR